MDLRVRVDSGVCAGLSISPYYDSLIAKIVVRGRTRGDAIKIMRRALNEFKVGGIKTTIPLHQRILKMNISAQVILIQDLLEIISLNMYNQ